jgi:hypothetical protein
MFYGETKMNNVLVAQTIIEVLEQMALDGIVFTAYDVTVGARAATTETVLHDDVRGIVENEFITSQLASYDRELCSLNLSGNPEAFVYFPAGKSASDHVLVDDNAVSQHVSQSVSQPISQPVTSAPAVTVDLDDDEYKTRSDGRIQIPVKLYTQVTPNAGSYDVLINGSLKCASTNARDEMRIGLRQFGIKDSKVKVTVDISANTIVIETI